MKSFKDFGIKSSVKSFTGEKIRIIKILNREITVHDFRVDESKYKDKGKCLCLSISVGETRHVIFSGSNSLIEMINQVPAGEFPFKTTIIQNDERYEFS